MFPFQHKSAFLLPMLHFPIRYNASNSRLDNNQPGSGDAPDVSQQGTSEQPPTTLEAACPIAVGVLEHGVIFLTLTYSAFDNASLHFCMPSYHAVQHLSKGNKSQHHAFHRRRINLNIFHFRTSRKRINF